MKHASTKLAVIAETGKPDTVNEAVFREIVAQLAGLRFGSLEIVVHEGRVTQIERRERLRFGQDANTKL